MSARRFLAIVFGAGAATVLAVAVANWWLDPFGGVTGNADGFYQNNDRELKLGLVRRGHPAGLLMGSSVVAEWPPSQIRSRRVLNAAWNAAMPEEMYYFLRDVDPKVGFIAVGFDFFMFSEAHYKWVEESVFTPIDPNLWSGNPLNVAMLRRNIEALRSRLRGDRPHVLVDGSRNSAPDEAADRRAATDYDVALRRLRWTAYGNYRWSERRVEALTRIRDWGAQRCVTLVPFINPLNAAVIDLITEMGLRDQWMRFRHDVRTVFPEAVDLSDGELSDSTLYWRADPFHYYPTTAAWIFEHKIEPALRAKEAVGCRPAPLPVR